MPYLVSVLEQKGDYIATACATSRGALIPKRPFLNRFRFAYNVDHSISFIPWNPCKGGKRVTDFTKLPSDLHSCHSTCAYMYIMHVLLDELRALLVLAFCQVYFARYSSVHL